MVCLSGNGTETEPQEPIPQSRKTWLPTVRLTGKGHRPITSAGAGIPTRISESWSRPCSESSLRIRLLRCFIIAAMPCFAFREPRNPDCLTSLVSMPYVLTDAHISLLTVPSRANALASLRHVVKMIS